MKKIKLTLILILCSISISEAQWIRQNSGTSGVALRDIHFINDNTGWICGDGTILKTTNAGENWVRQIHPATNKLLSGIHAVDSNVVYCVGWFETLLKTTNGGTNWIALRNGPVGIPNSYDAVFFSNENTGWFAGDGLYIKRTTDGGQTYDSTYIKWTYFTDFYFKDANTGLVCADGSGIFKTTNSGLTWIQKIVPTGFRIPQFDRISFVNNQFGWVVGHDSRVFMTSDFGETWDSIGFVYGADEPYCSNFISLNVGWVGGSYGELFKTTNGGRDWKLENTNSNQAYIGSIWFHNETTGWCVGGGDKLLYTENGGQTGITQISEEIPNEYVLSQNYPNPFNPETKINYQIKTSGEIKLIVYNMLGKEITELVNARQQPGSYQVTFDAAEKNLSSGIYIYSLFINNRLIDTKKMSLIK